MTAVGGGCGEERAAGDGALLGDRGLAAPAVMVRPGGEVGGAGEVAGEVDWERGEGGEDEGDVGRQKRPVDCPDDVGLPRACADSGGAQRGEDEEADGEDEGEPEGELLPGGGSKVGDEVYRKSQNWRSRSAAAEAGKFSERRTHQVAQDVQDSLRRRIVLDH